jgi:T5SS/PEP-CTERM-associated repeat protein
LNVYGSGSADLASRNLTLGSVANSTGMLTVADSGVVENIATFTIGDPGRGDVTVRDSGRVYTAWTDLNSTGGVSCALTVTNSGLFTNLRNIGGGADGMATVTLCGNATGTAFNSYSAVGAVDRSTGRLYVRNNAVFDGSGKPMFVGGGNASAGANTCTGIVEVSDFGMITNVYPDHR